MSEATFKAKVLEKYRKEGWLVIGLIQTTLNGIPDTLLMRKGDEPFFIEFKAKGKKPRELQQYRHKEIKEITGYETLVMIEP